MDWDKSGVSLQSERVNLGPSLGWVDVAGALLTITAAMSLAIPLGVQRINVSVAAGAVSLTLPSARGKLAIPSSLAIAPIVIGDIGGFADTNPITITAAVGELIGPVSSVSLVTKFGTLTLLPNPTAGTWRLGQ